MESLWIIILVGSVLLLCYIALNNKIKKSWITYILTNLVTAIVVLYLMNVTDFFSDYSVPINVVTVSTIGVLGIPGVLLLLGVKLFVV